MKVCFYWASYSLLRKTSKKCDSGHKRVDDYDDSFLDISPSITASDFSDTDISDFAFTRFPKNKAVHTRRLLPGVAPPPL